MINQNLCKVCLAICLALSVYRGEASEPNVLGRAFDQDSGKFLYSEHYSCSEDTLQCSVEYRDDTGVLIVHKELDYRGGRYSPSLRIHDYRKQTTLVVEPTAQRGLVVDAGFDNFVRSQWSSLSAGERVEFPFLVVGFDKPLSMIAKLDNSRPCPDWELCLEVRLDSWFLGLLAKPISLAYSREEKNLLRYQGISNIRNVDGGTLSVDILYRYREARIVGASAAQSEKSTFHF